MANTVPGIHGGLDTHANRPAGNAVPDGSLYSCSTHSLIYKSNYAGNSWATYASLSGTGAPSTAQYIVGALDGTLSAEKVRTDIYTNYHPDNLPAGLNAASSEFDGTGATYTWITNPTAHDVNSTYPGYLYIEQANALSPDAYRTAYVPGATDFTVVAKVSSAMPYPTNETLQIGVALLDSGDAAIWRCLILDNSVISATYLRFFDTVGVNGQIYVQMGTPVYVMIQRTSANVYKGFFSIDGLIWIEGGSSTVATTVAKVGIQLNTGGTTKKYATVDFIRVFGSLTRKIGA